MAREGWLEGLIYAGAAGGIGFLSLTLGKYNSITCFVRGAAYIFLAVFCLPLIVD